MTDPTMETLVGRLDRLEHEIHRWRLVVLAALCVMVAVGVLFWYSLPRPGPRTAVVETEQLVIRDSAGRQRVMIGRAVPHFPSQPTAVAKFETPQFGLFVYAEDGKALASLTAESTGPTDGRASLHLMSPDDKTVAMLDLSSSAVGSGWVGFGLASQIASTRPGAAVDLMVWDDITPAGGPYAKVVVGGAAGLATRPYGTLEWRRDGARPAFSHLTLFDEARRERATLGHTTLEVTRNGSIEERSESSLILFDKNGKVLWKTP